MVEKGELTVPGIDFELDKLHEECGVFGIYSHKDDVALNTYWGLYALQHRGQESTGIVTTDGSNMQVKKGMGLVSDVYKDGVGDLTGHIDIGHVRYSTTGSSMAYNTQPLRVYFDGRSPLQIPSSPTCSALKSRIRFRCSYTLSVTLFPNT